MHIGPYKLDSNLIAAPMAGITDKPWRILCRRFGAGLAVSEMLAADSSLRNTRKSRLRRDHKGEESALRDVQIVGTDPQVMAQAARYNVELGAQIIDINMGCPAKKVCSVAAGSALMRDVPLVTEILDAVVNAVDVPVTLKMRTGWDPEHRNALDIARIAEDKGIAMLAVHGRTRTCGYKGDAEYDTIGRIKQNVSIPVVANGDIDSAEKAARVLEHTGADGLMIGRAAQGNPWIFADILHYLRSGESAAARSLSETEAVLLEHVSGIHALYGPVMGPRVARKHIAWYCSQVPGYEEVRRDINACEDTDNQIKQLRQLFGSARSSQRKVA